MGSRPPVAPDRAAAPVQGFDTPNAASTDSEASSTVAWETVCAQHQQLPRLRACPHPVVHWLASRKSFFVLACLSALLGAAAVLPFQNVPHSCPHARRLCGRSWWTRAAPRLHCPHSRPPLATAGAAGRRGTAAPARRPAGCMRHRRSLASASRQTTCCTSACAWGAARQARCSGEPLPLRPPVRLAGKLPALCQLPLWRTSMPLTRQHPK